MTRQRLPDDSVSVIVPTRDRHDLLLRALESIEHQTHGNHKTTVVDDGSSTPVSDVVRAIPDCRVVRNPRPLGPAASRNIGARLAAGAFVAFLDDDDWYLPRKLERSLACLLAHPSAVGLFHRIAADPTDAVGSSRCELLTSPVTRMLVEQPPHVDTLLVRAEVHDRIELDEGYPAAADLDYCLRLAQAGPLVDLDEVLAGRGDGAATLVGVERRIEGRKLFADRHRDVMKAHPGAVEFHRVRLGSLYLRAGRRGAALVTTLRAAASRPANRSGWSGLAAAVLPGSAYAAVAASTRRLRSSTRS
jgi:glycosyltransferase involved in cell wall biosynthesis